MNELPSSKYCCTLFHGAVAEKSKRGISIEPIRAPKFGDFFFLVFRVADEDDNIQKCDLRYLPVKMREVPLVLFTRQAIRFCPWCGNDLKSFYKKKFDFLPFGIEDDP